MAFSQDVWQRNVDLYQKTLALPFNQELASGTLNKEAFCHYVIQDAHYLVAYGRALAVCGAKAYEADDIIQFSQGAKEAIVVERSLHDGFMKNFDISKQQFEETPLTLACHHYTSFLTATAWSESYPVVLAALLPCFGFMLKWVKTLWVTLSPTTRTKRGLILTRGKNSTKRYVM